jgi:hypothetical protein
MILRVSGAKSGNGRTPVSRHLLTCSSEALTSSSSIGGSEAQSNQLAVDARRTTAHSRDGVIGQPAVGDVQQIRRGDYDRKATADLKDLSGHTRNSQAATGDIGVVVGRSCISCIDHFIVTGKPLFSSQ